MWGSWGSLLFFLFWLVTSEGNWHGETPAYKTCLYIVNSDPSCSHSTLKFTKPLPINHFFDPQKPSVKYKITLLSLVYKKWIQLWNGINAYIPGWVWKLSKIIFFFLIHFLRSPLLYFYNFIQIHITKNTPWYFMNKGKWNLCVHFPIPWGGN